MEFSLFKEFGGLSPMQLVMLLVCAAAVVLLAVLIKKSPGQFDTRTLVYASMCVALGFALSFFRVLKMPQGGSITIASMLPVMVFAYWFGVRKGLLAALVFAVLQFIQEPYFVHPMQVLLDYVLAFGALALAGTFKGRLLPGILLAGTVRVICSTLSGVIFFAEYAGGQNVWVYSLVYNLTSIGIDTLICFAVAAVPQMRNVVESLKTQTAK